MPLMPAALKSVPWVTVLLRLKTSVPLSVIELLVESEPVVPPLPICRVPALIVGAAGVGVRSGQHQLSWT